MSLYAPTPTWHQQPAYEPHSLSAPSSPYLAASRRSPSPALSEVIDTAKKATSQLEDRFDAIARPLRPYFPAIARLMIVFSFLEDAWRIITQFGNQVWYLQTHRHFPWGLSHAFLLMNITLMITGSFAIIGRRRPPLAAGALCATLLFQAIAYGLIFDLDFFLRNVSVAGGLMMVLSEGMGAGKGNSSSHAAFAGLPEISDNDRKKYFQLVGRILLIFLFIGFVFQGEWSLSRFLCSIVGLALVGMIVAGFKARWAAVLLVILLSTFNVIINSFWKLHPQHAEKDFQQFDFFQTVSIVGGLLMMINIGAGSISLDEKKKHY